jgi:hypothetical protein
MKFPDIPLKPWSWAPALACLLSFASGEGYAQVSLYSENSDGAVRPYTAVASYANADCSNYIVADETGAAVCGGSFWCAPVITSASGDGKRLPSSIRPAPAKPFCGGGSSPGTTPIILSWKHQPVVPVSIWNPFCRGSVWRDWIAKPKQAVSNL